MHQKCYKHRNFHKIFLLYNTKNYKRKTIFLNKCRLNNMHSW